MKKTVADSPDLLCQWNYKKNPDLNPDTITLGSGIKVWWKCSEGHEWQATIAHRASGRGCPYCSGRYALSGENDLATLFPDISKEWHPTKNGALSPSQFLPKSGKKVWWKCSEGHEWQATIAHRANGRGCPYCSGRTALEGETDLSSLFPALAAEWHPTKNGKLLPTQVRPGSNKKVWWLCTKEHAWEDTPNHRTRGRGCPYCSHKRVTSENSLSSLFPGLLEEWDYQKNKHSPDEYAAFSNKQVYWICKSCGEGWLASITSRTKLGSGCPVCKNLHIVPGVNDLVTINPLLAEEWDYEKNKLSPASVGAGSTKRVWWKCAFGHSWEAPINRRNRGESCPKCNRYLKTSIQEHVVFYYIEQYFSDAINSYSPEELQKKEIDIYIPSKQTGIEYDGQYWHTSFEKDLQKDLLCSSHGITLIRIREPECPPISRTMPTYTLEDTSSAALQAVIISILKWLSVTDFQVNIEKDYKKILESYRSDFVGSNFENKYPEIASQWHPTLNGTLRPANFPGTASKTEVFWLCPKCDSTWKATIDSRIHGSGCPVCAGRKVKKGYNDLQTNYPQIAETWHPTKNGELSATDVTSHSHKSVWWICIHGHEWTATVKDRVDGNGCPFCSGKRVLKGYNDLATVNPALAEEWDLQNNNRSPDEISAHSGYKANWICKKCGFGWKASVDNRAKGSGCPNCAKEKRKPKKHINKKTK